MGRLGRFFVAVVACPLVTLALVVAGLPYTSNVASAAPDDPWRPVARAVRATQPVWRPASLRLGAALPLVNVEFYACPSGSAYECCSASTASGAAGKSGSLVVATYGADADDPALEGKASLLVSQWPLRVGSVCIPDLATMYGSVGDVSVPGGRVRVMAACWDRPTAHGGTVGLGARCRASDVLRGGGAVLWLSAAPRVPGSLQAGMLIESRGLDYRQLIAIARGMRPVAPGGDFGA